MDYKVENTTDKHLILTKAYLFSEQTRSCTAEAAPGK